MCVCVCVGCDFGDKKLPANLRVVTEKKRSINGGRIKESGVPFSHKENGMFSHPLFLGFFVLISCFPILSTDHQPTDQPTNRLTN